MEIIEINDFKNKKSYVVNEDSKRLDNFNLNCKITEIKNNDRPVNEKVYEGSIIFRINKIPNEACNIHETLHACS